MTAALSTPTVTAAIPRKRSRIPVAVIVTLAVVWCAVLAGLVLTAANPIVLNPVQFWHAEVVVQGQWIPGRPSQIDVQRTWKGDIPQGKLTVHGGLPEQNVSAEVVVPLSRDRDGRWMVTGGVLLNPLRDHTAHKSPVQATVRPVIYPATADVLRQLPAMLDQVFIPPL